VLRDEQDYEVAPDDDNEVFEEEMDEIQTGDAEKMFLDGYEIKADGDDEEEEDDDDDEAESDDDDDADDDGENDGIGHFFFTDTLLPRC
jgi:hypothetical protein